MLTGATLTNKYSLWYDALIAKARSREPLTGYRERHHVIPSCLGGSDAKSNLVTLTYREHFLAHWLLTKFTTGDVRKKMLHAMAATGGPRAGRVVASWQCKKARRARAEVMSVVMVGNKYALGRKHTAAAREKMSAAQVGNKKGLGNKNSLGLRFDYKPRPRMAGNQHTLGLKHTIEARAKMAAAHVGRPGRKHTIESKAKLAAAAVGRKHTTETRAKMSLANIARHARRRALAAGTAPVPDIKAAA
jgi:NUMOD3 motif